MTALADALLDLVLPRHCLGCAEQGSALCPACRPDTPLLTPGGVWAAGEYEDGLRDALLAYKERGRRDLAGVLGTLLADAVRAAGPPPGVVLVPVPSSRRAVRDRGGDHVLRLARRTSRLTGIPVRRPLRLVRSVADSAGLGTQARAANLHRAMAASRPSRLGTAATVLLVDDIVTTGATFAEASRALRMSGWRVVAAAAVAATRRRDGADPISACPPRRTGHFGPGRLPGSGLPWAGPDR
jgi:predicted amidophosphoribosyltransferase